MLLVLVPFLLLVRISCRVPRAACQGCRVLGPRCLAQLLVQPLALPVE